MRLAPIAKLAWADLRHDWLVSLCMVMSLVAVIAPLLLLFGLKYGVISALQSQLLTDPRNLEIRMLGSGSYDQAWIERLRADPDAGFVLGLTRSLNTQADLTRSGNRFLENTEILPTAPGDPLLPGLDIASLDYADTVLSAQAAERLAIQPGDTLRLRILRRMEGTDQRAELTLTVQAILPPERYGRPAAFVRPELLRDMEWYRDGYAIPAFGVADGKSPDAAQIRFARARIYARDIDLVESLEKTLNAQRIDTTSRLADIHNVKAINYLLTTVFAVIAGTALLGCMASLAGAVLANIRRKRRDIATLRLLGLKGHDISTYILLQSATLTLFAFVLGLLAYFAGSSIFNHLLGLAQATGQFACRITPGHALAALALTLGVSLCVSFAGTRIARHIQPAESLREI